VAPLARKLSLEEGVLEPYQLADSVSGQIMELRDYLTGLAEFPVILVGHSWGAWLGFLFAAEYPDFVQKLILISSGPFEARYAEAIVDIRLIRLSSGERSIYDRIVGKWDHVSENEKKLLFKTLGRLMMKADSYDPVDLDDYTVEYQPAIFRKIWSEASYLRSSGDLLKKGTKIMCPVVAIHGDHDPHPWEGVREPLNQLLDEFRFFLLKKCGHEPWNEKHARDEFYKIICTELLR
jgi:pimeloyl-ACP methyl ester carboxylesterase